MPRRVPYRLYQRPGSDLWYVDIRRAGRARLRQSTGTSNRAEAEQVALEAAARAGSEHDTGRWFTDALAAWLTAEERSAQELRGLKRISALYKDRPLREVSGEGVADAFADLKPATRNRLTTIIRAALNIAEGRGWIARAPRIARAKVRRESFRWLTPAEWSALRDALPAHLRPMADFAIATGLRWGNVAGLTWDRVDLRGKRAWIEAGSAKGRRAIAVPLSAAALQALRDAQGERMGYVFTYHGAPLQSPKTAWRSAIARAGIESVRWHDLRHTWASWHVQNGTPLAALKELGGWASLDQVMIYAHLAPSHVAQYAANAAPKGPTKGHRSAKKAA